MADDGIQPTPLGQTMPSKPIPDGAIRPGSPGAPTDTVLSSRVPQPKTPKVEKPAEIKDPFREIIETVVFVIVLVFMLKTFLAEAFVIPTGSMATTLLGYHKDIACEKCGYEYRVNCSAEAEDQMDGRRPLDPIVKWSDCPNCQYRNPVR